MTQNELLKSSNSLKSNYQNLVKLHSEIERVSKNPEIFHQKLILSEIDYKGVEYVRELPYPNGLEIFSGTSFILSSTPFEKIKNNKTTEFKTLAQRDFYLVWKNGLYDLIGYSQDLSESILSFYLKYISSYKVVFMIICSLGVVFTFISLVIIIPIVITIYRTNRKVLSLFGSITPNQIQSMIDICQKFKERCLLSAAGKPKRKLSNVRAG